VQLLATAVRFIFIGRPWWKWKWSRSRSWQQEQWRKSKEKDLKEKEGVGIRNTGPGARRAGSRWEPGAPGQLELELALWVL
jgi:hypothetical protein